MAEVVELDQENAPLRSSKSKVLSEDEILMLGLGSSDPTSKSTLQDRFLRFKDDRLRERRLARTAVKKVERNEAFRENLRIKFVETCKQYLGIPYHPQYHGPESPHHNAPLYLDCCGLIRRALQDLHADFGFKIGRWNQNYLYDALSESVDGIECMRPGDLIFVSGTYLNPKSRRQKYDMVHVEVFLGGDSGEQTIGARAQKGVISIHNSYKYSSLKYEITGFYFMSLDPWLRGELTLRHPEHWSSRDANIAGSVDIDESRSIFADADGSGDEGEP